MEMQKMYKPNQTLPVAASFLVTEDCNLRCTYCFEKHNKKSMSPAVAKRAVRFLFENAVKSGENNIGITFFGGEPSLVPDILEIIFKECLIMREQTRKDFNINMITNSTVMNPELYSVLDKYKDTCHFSVQLSIDGIQEVQDMYRKTVDGKGSFHLAEKVVPVYKEMFKNSMDRINIHGCMNKQSLPYLYENYIFFREVWGIESIWFLPVCEEDWEASDILIYKEQLGKIADYILDKVKETGSLKEVKLYAPLDRCLRQPYLANSGAPCGAGKNYCTITATGELYPCHHIYFNDADKETLFGNIWDGVDEDKRRLFTEYDSTDMSCPQDCNHGACYRCIAVNYVHNGSILSQVRGNYCALMKVDYYYQQKLREGLMDMGLIPPTHDRQSLGEQRIPMPPSSSCDVVEKIMNRGEK